MNDPTQSAPSAIIEVTGVSKTYRVGKREVQALRNVDLRVANGEFVALVGASGTGKSTLLHLLGGLDRPDQGRIRCAGVEIAQVSQGKRALYRRDSIGFVFQAYHLLPELDALENVALPARIRRERSGATQERAASLLQRVGLGERTHHRPVELSGGEQQRVAIARALINDPAVILADEPTGNLDTHTGNEILQILQNLGRELGKTLLIATHSAELAARADRVVRLVDGVAQESTS